MAGLPQELIEHGPEVERIRNPVIRILEFRNPPGIELSDGEERMFRQTTARRCHIRFQLVFKLIASGAAELARMVPTVLTSLPKPQALMDTVRKIAAAKLPRKVVL